MTHSEHETPEQPRSAEYTPLTAELYDYKTVIDALRDRDVPDDDIAYIGGVVVNWAYSIPSWGSVEDVRRLGRSLDTTLSSTAEAVKLLQQTETLFADEHWDQALEVQREGNKILSEHPGLFIFDDAESREHFPIESFLLTSDQTSRADLYVTGSGKTLRAKRGASVYIDVAKLSADEYAAVEAYAALLELTSSNLE